MNKFGSFVVGLFLGVVIGFAFGYNNHDRCLSEVDLVPTIQVDTVHTRDTIYIPKDTIIKVPTYIYIDRKEITNDLDSVESVTIPDTAIHTVAGRIDDTELDLTWDAKIACVNNSPRIFDFKASYVVKTPVILDTIRINTIVTKPVAIKPQTRHLSFGGTVSLPTYMYAVDMRYHRKWWYLGGSIGQVALASNDRRLYAGLSAGININLK